MPNRNPLTPYADDTPTQLSKSASRSFDDASSSDAEIRSIHKQETQPIRTTERVKRLRELRAANDRRVHAPTLPAVPDEQTQEPHPFNRDYIINRLNRAICTAQDAGDYREAIRLQVLQWYLNDERLSPVAVARKAWLRPAANP